MRKALPAVLSIVVLAAVQLGAHGTAPAKDGGAKGMFYEQLEHPSEKLNNGIQYWIELKRGGQTQRVNNKFAFRSGDQIRFHIKSNTDGFAYVILREGSRGERSVLFPDRRHADDNHIRSNVEYTVPGDSFLQFDEYPGTEKVTLVLSRSNIEPNRYMPDSFRNKVTIAARQEGSKDLVPGSFVVSYEPQPSNIAHATTPSSPVTNASTPAPIAAADNADSIITVVQKNPSETLAVDVCLEHVQ